MNKEIQVSNESGWKNLCIFEENGEMVLYGEKDGVANSCRHILLKDHIYKINRDFIQFAPKSQPMSKRVAIAGFEKRSDMVTILMAIHHSRFTVELPG